jgi:hypothetical protein
MSANDLPDFPGTAEMFEMFFGGSDEVAARFSDPRTKNLVVGVRRVGSVQQSGRSARRFSAT